MDFRNSDVPKCITWFKVYCGIMTFIYLALMGSSSIFLLVDPETLEMEPVMAKIVGVLLFGMSAALSAAFLLPFFVKPKPWVWIYGLILICIGLTSCCFWPICIPLLIFWLKLETKKHFDHKES